MNTEFGIENQLEKLFEPQKEELERSADELVQSNRDRATIVGKYTNLVDTTIDSFLQKSYLDLRSGLNLLQSRYSQCVERIKNLEYNLSDFLKKRDSIMSEANASRTPWFYFLMYGLLLVAMFAAAAFTADMLFAEQGRILSWVTSIVFIGGSYFVRSLYMSFAPDRRKRFYKILNLLGVVLFVCMAIAFAYGRSIALHELHNNNSIFSEDNVEAGFEAKQYITSCLAFIFMVLLELCFASSLLISIHVQTEPEKTLVATEKSIAQIEHDIGTRTAQAEVLAVQIEEIENLNEYQESWAKKTKLDRLNKFETRLDDLANKARMQIVNFPDHIVRFYQEIGEQLEKGGNNNNVTLQINRDNNDNNNFSGDALPKHR